MGTVSKIDGFNGVKEQRARFVDLYATEAIAKGDLVAFDFTLDSTNEQEPGHGIRICRADSDDTTDDFKSQWIGVAVEAIASGKYGTVQVSGRCNICKVAASIDAGLLVKANTTAGNGAVAWTNSEIILPTAMFVAFGSAHAADSTVLLLNPFNL